MEDINLKFIRDQGIYLKEEANEIRQFIYEDEKGHYIFPKDLMKYEKFLRNVILTLKEKDLSLEDSAEILDKTAKWLRRKDEILSQKHKI